MGGWAIETIAKYFLVVYFITEEKAHRFYGCCHLYKVLLCCCIVGDPENILNFLEASF